MYATATLIGGGLRDDDLRKAFAKMIRRKMSKETCDEWPMTADELIARLAKRGRGQGHVTLNFLGVKCQ